MRTAVAQAALLCLLAVGLAGCNRELTREQRALLIAGEESFARADYPGTIGQLSRFLAQVNDDPTVARAAYVRGLARLRTGQRGEAAVDLSRAARGGGDPDAVWRARVALGTLYFEDARWRDAIVQLEAVVDRMPSSEGRDAALFRLAVCYEKVAQPREARALFQRVVSEYSGGPYREEARRRLAGAASAAPAGGGAFALQCGAFSLERNADELARRLRGRGFSAYARREPRGVGHVHVVYVGDYSSRTEAERNLLAVRPHAGDARVVQR